MAFSQEHIDALKEAIALGATSVSYNGRTTTYRSLKEMRETLALMQTDVMPGGGTPTRTTYATFRRD